MPRQAQCSRCAPAAAPLGRLLADVPTRNTEQLQTSKVALAPTLPAVKNLDVSTPVNASYLNAVKRRSPGRTDSCTPPRAGRT